MIDFTTYDFFTDAVFIIDDNGDICYVNESFNKDFSNVKKDINKIIPYFDFDVCILDNSMIRETTPISLAIKCIQNYSCSALNVQTGIQYEIFSFKREKYTIVILKAQTKDVSEFNKKIKALESENKRAEELQKQAQSQAAKIGLLNRIYTIIQQENELDDILKHAYEELRKVFGVDKLFFAKKENNYFEITDIFPSKLSYTKGVEFNYQLNTNVYSVEKYQKDFDFFKIEAKAKQMIRILVPVNDRHNVLGFLCFTLPQKNYLLIEEDFLNSLCSQLAAAVLQAILSQQLKENQLQLVNSEKMATLGNMIAAVAHEINTPIGAINSNNELLAKLIEKNIDDSKQDKILKIVQTSLNCDKEAIKRIMSIVKALKKFIRLDEAKMQITDITKELDLTIDLCQHLLKNKIIIEKNYEPIPQIYTHPNMLNQVFMNLITNAAQSIKEKGKIIIHTFANDNNILISIKDNGCGIAEEIKGQIFRQGFTTKQKGEGTGLGLSISQKIMEQLGGEITFTSQKGVGSEFVVKLPQKENE